jgi:hypothetical protein
MSVARPKVVSGKGGRRMDKERRAPIRREMGSGFSALGNKSLLRPDPQSSRNQGDLTSAQLKVLAKLVREEFT